MNAIIELEQLGYTFTVEGESIRYRLAGAITDPVLARALLAKLQAQKAEALEWLQIRQLPKRIPLNDLYLYSSVLTADVVRKHYRLE